MLYCIYFPKITSAIFCEIRTGGIHTMKSRLSRPRNRLLQYWPVILFLLSFAASVITTYYVTKNIIDSDASSELVLSHYLAHTDDFLLSRDWFYSTELRVLNTQLIYSAMFRLFSDWSFVRFCSAMVMQVILLISCGFLLHEAGFGKKEFFLSGSLLLFPISVTYGRIVLYHCYYIPHLALSFFLVGLTLGFAKPLRLRSWRPWIRLALLALFSFLGGLGGVRQLLITHVPLLLCIVFFCFLEDAKEADRSKSSFLSPGNLPLEIAALAGALFSFAGLKVNTGILAQHYSFDQQTDLLIGLLPPEEFASVAYGFFHHFGFRQKLPLLSLMGILSIGGIFAGGYCIYLSLRRFLAHADAPDIRRNLVRLLFLSVTVVTLAVFVICGKDGNYYYVLYLVFSLPWAVLLLASQLTELPRGTHILRSARLLPIAAVLILLANGFVNMLFFNGNEKFKQPYEGLRYSNMHVKDSLAGAVAFVTENGYDLGYATFWNCNVVSEITDGRVRMVCVSLISKQSRVVYRDWLNFRSYRELPAEKSFMLITVSELKNFKQTEAYENCELVYRDKNYCVFDILHQTRFRDILNTDLS